jgi:hypothetical protein
LAADNLRFNNRQPGGFDIDVDTAISGGVDCHAKHYGS